MSNPEATAKKKGTTGNGYVFLSPEWVQEVSRVVQTAKRTKSDFGKLASRLNLGLAYVITGLPPELSQHYGGQQMVIFVRLQKGIVQKLVTGAEVPDEKIDFKITSVYNQARSILLGETNPATSFVNHQIQVEPLREVYRRPRFTARSIVMGNQMLKFIRQIPTKFAEEQAPGWLADKDLGV